MYHCHIHFYLIGNQNQAFEIIKKMSPLEHFSHEFYESIKPEESFIKTSDIIFMNLQGMDKNNVLTFLKKNIETECILLAEKNQIPLLSNHIFSFKDIWTLPMSDEEIKFHFLRWQQNYKTEKDFWQTNHYLEATINNVPNLIWYKTKDGIHEKVNESFCKTVNKTMKQVEGQRHAYIWDVEHDDPACIESEREVMSKKKTCISEETIQTGNGVRQLTTYKSPLYNIDGSVMGTVGVAIDITQERAYEQELIKKNRTLETIFTSIDCGVLSHGLDGKKVFNINLAALEILGYDSLDEFMASDFNMVASTVVDEDKPIIINSIKELKNEGDSTSVNYRVQHKNGEIRYVMGTIKLLKENDELFYQRFLIDCTTQKIEEKKNERYHMTLVQALSIDFNLVCFFNLDSGKGKPLRIDNDHMFDSIFHEDLLLQESIELYIQNFVYEDDKNMMRQMLSSDNLKKELSSKKIHYVTYRTFKDGEMKYYEMKAVRTGTWNKSHDIVLGIRSVDEEIRKEMEQRTLLEDALLQANKANKAKSSFLSNMSHDIRTPMNAIIGFTTLAINHINNKNQVEDYLNKIMSSGNHLLNLINDVLDMSRIESGKMNIEEKPCNLPDIIHNLHNIVQTDIQKKQLNLHIDTINIIDEDIYCDQLRLNQVLLNLLSNSIKYTNAGNSIYIKITEKASTDKNYANYEFCIKDTGIGMHKDFVSHIFEPFEREKNTTFSGVQGTGLGMAITKNIVDMMNGSIEIKSEQYVGTEVTVSFTFRLCPKEDTSLILPELNNCHALIIDSDLSSGENTSHLLQQLGIQADWSLSEKEALLRIHQNNNYDIYLIDWLLFNENGIEIIQKIKKENDKNILFIIMVMNNLTNMNEEFISQNNIVFCKKPLFLSELRDCICSTFNTNTIQIDNEKELSQFKGRILLVEDNELNQEIAVEILSDAGFNMEIADNGQMAVDMLNNSEPGYYQLVLMDIQMPIMNGYDATKAIRQLENKDLSSIPILAMTANAFEEDKQKALKSGMNGHITKPIDVEKLLDTLDKVIN